MKALAKHLLLANLLTDDRKDSIIIVTLVS